METRNVELTLEKAQEWYKKSGDLKEIALQAYTVEELTTPEWKNIKTFEDACRALGISDIHLGLSFTGRGQGEYEHLVAINRLDIVRRALNQGWKPKITEAIIYYPYIRLYFAGEVAKEVARSNEWYVKETFKADGNKYSLVGGDYKGYCGVGLCNSGYGCGDVITNLGLLGCKSRKIAQHMSRYFAKEIFEACYAHHTGAYEWV